MNLYAKSLLFQTAKKYVNYISQVVAYPTTRIQVDNVADDFSEVYASNVSTSVGYLRFYLESENLEFVSDSKYIYANDGYTNGYWQIRIQPTKDGIVVGNTYEIPCSIVDSDTRKTVQEFIVYYTRTV